MAVDLDGSSQYGTTPSSSVNLDEGTFSGWFYVDNWGGNSFFWDTDGTRHAMYYASALQIIQIYIDGYTNNYNVALSTGSWVHYAMGYKKTGTIQKFWINGVAQTTTGAAGAWGSTGLGTNLYLAHRISELNGNYIDGRIAEFATYNKILSDAEVAQLALGAAPSMVRTDALISYWPIIINDGQQRWGSNAITYVASPPSFAHNRMFYPARKQIKITAGAGGNITTTKTTTGVSRVTATSTQTTAGKGRIQNTATQTTTGKSRIQKSVTATQTGVGRIQNTSSQATTGKARIQNTSSQTTTGKARVQATSSQTQNGKARVQNTSTQTTAGVARIQKSVAQTISGVANIVSSTASFQTINGVARITASTTRTTTGVGRIQKSASQTTSGVSRIQQSVSQTIAGVSRIVKSVLATITGNARITASSSQTQSGKANIIGTTTRNITGLAFIVPEGGGIVSKGRTILTSTSDNTRKVLKSKQDITIL